MLTIRRKYAALVLIPAFLFLAIELSLALLARHGNFQPSTVVTDYSKAMLPEIALRLRVIALWILFVGSCTALAAKVAFDVLKIYKGKSLITLGSLFVFIILVEILYLITTSHQLTLNSVSYVGISVYDTATAIFSERHSLRIWGKDTFYALVLSSEFFAGIALAAALVSAYSCLGENAQNTKEVWRWQSDRLKTYSYYGTGVFVIGVIYLQSWSHYPEFMMGDANERAGFQSAVNAWSMMAGIEFSILLASAIIPVGFALSGKADQIALQIAGIGDRQGAGPAAKLFSNEIAEIREKEKLTVAPLDSLKIFAALLAPLVTGAFSSLSEALT